MALEISLCSLHRLRDEFITAQYSATIFFVIPIIHFVDAIKSNLRNRFHSSARLIVIIVVSCITCRHRRHNTLLALTKKCEWMRSPHQRTIPASFIIFLLLASPPLISINFSFLPTSTLHSNHCHRNIIMHRDILIHLHIVCLYLCCHLHHYCSQYERTLIICRPNRMIGQP